MKTTLQSILASLGIIMCGLGVVSCAHTSNINLGKGQNLGSGSDDSSGMLLTKHELMEAPPPGRLNGGF